MSVAARHLATIGLGVLVWLHAHLHHTSSLSAAKIDRVAIHAKEITSDERMHTTYNACEVLKHL